jgi:oligopeptide/dipeptide ABC transporter ATP-binding protein
VNDTLIQINGLKKYYPITGGLFSKVVGWVKSLDNVSFEIKSGETFGIVGESGCGKSTLGRTLLRLVEPTEGQVYFKGKNIYGLRGDELLSLRKQMQIIFQDPYSSLNPRMKIGAILDEPLRINGFGSQAKRKQYIHELLYLVGLNENYLSRLPHELSGGQRQRVGIARALLLKPDFIVCDEAVSALDVSIRSQIINLLKDLQGQFGLTYLFIAHDLSVVRHISDRIAVMYLGEIVELTDKKSLFQQPLHPYTEALLSSVPLADPHSKNQLNRIVLNGDVPSPANPPTGCRFHTRCPYSREICKMEKPVLMNLNKGSSIDHASHLVACHFAAELDLQGIQELH